MMYGRLGFAAFDHFFRCDAQFAGKIVNAHGNVFAGMSSCLRRRCRTGFLAGLIAMAVSSSAAPAPALSAWRRLTGPMIGLRLRCWVAVLRGVD
jgi:hypothetical protein